VSIKSKTVLSKQFDSLSRIIPNIIHEIVSNLYNKEGSPKLVNPKKTNEKKFITNCRIFFLVKKIWLRKFDKNNFILGPRWGLVVRRVASYKVKKTRVALTVFVLFFAICSASMIGQVHASVGDWPMFRHDHSTLGVQVQLPVALLGCSRQSMSYVVLQLLLTALCTSAPTTITFTL